MIIHKIEIENFRSYYKDNVFELTNGLNLIIGSNGDGKTTFYEALEWLLRTDGTNKTHLKYIVYQRSQDAVFGYDNDILWHQNVQLMLANKLSESTALNQKIICDNIINNVGSLHVYERHFKYLDEH